MEILDLGIDYGTIATLSYKTQIIVKGDGTEQRNINWHDGLLSFQIGKRTLNNTELSELMEFHQARKGRFEAFLFKDWSDYKLEGATLAESAEFPGEYLIVKSYSIEETTVTRPIFHPIIDTIKPYVLVGEPPDPIEKVYIEDFTIDPETGLITIGNANALIEGEFYIPVRFAEDAINFKFLAYERFTSEKIFELESLTLTEVRVNNPLPLYTIPLDFSHPIALGVDLDTMGGKSFNTTIAPISSGFETRLSNWEVSKGTYDIGSRSLLRSELDYLIALFRVTKGRGLEFQYFDYQQNQEINARFGEDSISFRFDAFEPSSEEVIFNLAGTPIKEIQPYLDPNSEYFTVSFNWRYKRFNWSDNHPNWVNWHWVSATLPLKKPFHSYSIYGNFNVLGVEIIYGDEFKKGILRLVVGAVEDPSYYTFEVANFAVRDWGDPPPPNPLP